MKNPIKLDISLPSLFQIVWFFWVNNWKTKLFGNEQILQSQNYYTKIFSTQVTTDHNYKPFFTEGIALFRKILTLRFEISGE